MKPIILTLGSMWLLVCTVPYSLAQNAPTFDIRRPTIVAFFAPITQSELLHDPDSNEALADFQFYATKVRQPLEKAGVDFREAYAQGFHVRLGKTVTTFRPVKDAGYYFVAPGKKPHVEYGVMTDAGLLEAASEYFGTIRK